MLRKDRNTNYRKLSIINFAINNLSTTINYIIAVFTEG